jgi:hypothetical protein
MWINIGQNFAKIWNSNNKFLKIIISQDSKI